MSNAALPTPTRGEIWMADLNPVIGREQADVRPVVILSVAAFNQSGAELVIVLPLTSKDKGYPQHIAVSPPEGGLSVRSFIKCEDVRSISKEQLRELRGSVSLLTLQMVEDRVRLLIGL